MSTVRELFLERGYVRLPQERLQIDLGRIEQEYAVLMRHAQSALGEPSRGAGPSSRMSGLVPVPEAQDARLLCRFEYLAGASAYIEEALVGPMASLIESVLGQAVNLFKDKCNLKHPGAGAFTAHQDITAYHHFGSSYQVTAALMLDPATALNGGLEMASRWDAGAGAVRDTPRGPQAMLPSYVGGRRNGDILDELVEQMDWELVEAAPGEVILFDSYVPHRSQVNRSDATRRILFFTFNLASDGDLYEAYYEAKRAAPDNPIFHVSTPTLHSARDEAPVQNTLAAPPRQRRQS